MKYRIDLQKIADALEFDVEDVEIIMESFLQDAISNLDNLKQAIQTNNLEAVAAISHAIKGSASNLLLSDVTELAKKIEQNAISSNEVNYMQDYSELKELLESLYYEE